MKHILFVLIGCLCAATLSAQTNKMVNELESRRVELQKQIATSEALLKEAKEDVGSQLNALSVLTAQIEERRRYIVTINNDILLIDRELTSIERQLDELEKELTGKKKSYESSVQFLQKNKSIEEKLMFIFSAKDLNQTYRRMRYVREYATYQRLQGEEIKGKHRQINEKKWELQEVKEAQERLLAERDREKEKLEQQEKQQKALIAGLQNKQQELQNEINRKRKEADQLNDHIDMLIADDITRSRRRAEEEKLRAANEVKPEEEGILDFELEIPEPSASSGQNTASTTPKTTSRSSASSPASRRPAAASQRYIMNKEEKALSGNFVSNRGKLPMPVTGVSMITNRYGRNRVDGLRYVRLDNRGIDIQGEPGAEARAVFNGEVTGVFVVSGLMNVMVRHGEYISVYGNLSSTSVQNGDKVQTGQSLGKIYADPEAGSVLHFQLRKEKQALNPEPWLRK